MTSEELSVLPDATLLAIARTVKHCEASEAQGELVLELAKRLSDRILREQDSHFNFLTRD